MSVQDMAKRLNKIIACVPSANHWKLDKEIDFENKNVRGQVIPKHLGRIAESMTDWEDVADDLELSIADRSDIKQSNSPKQQRYS